MANELIDLMRSLTTIMQEETAKLRSPGPHADLSELAGAKIRLVAALEARTAELARTQPDWVEKLDPDLRDDLAAALVDLRDVSAINAEVLERQIDLSSEMMAAVAAEARRVAGTHSTTYGAAGGVFRTDMAAPISVNARL